MITKVLNYKDIALIFILFITVRILSFIFFGYVQEDAFIYLSIAKNLSLHGDYSFNLGDNVSAATSHLYLLFVAFFRFLFEHQGTFISLNVLNSIFQFFSVLIWGKIFFIKKSNLRAFLLIMTFIPISITLSNIGMETSLLVFCFSIGFYFIKKDIFSGLVLLMLILPLVRPDAIFFSVLLTFTYALHYKDRWRNILYLSVSFIFGALIYISINLLFFDVYINQTIIAKSVAYEMPMTIIGIMERVSYNMNSTFAPMSMTFLKSAIVTFFGLIIFIVALHNLYKAKKDYILIFFIFSTSLGLPLIYGLKAATFPWYIHPSTFMVYISIVFLMINKRNISLIRYLGIFIVMALFLVQLIFLRNTSLKEEYRASIGKFIKSRTNKDATIFLEPLGYIPYFAERYTYCEVGLITPEVTSFRKKYGNIDFHQQFLINKKPDVFVVRDTKKWGLSQKWLNENYYLKKRFVYKNAFKNEELNLLDKFIFENGSAVDYYIFFKK